MALSAAMPVASGIWSRLRHETAALMVYVIDDLADGHAQPQYSRRVVTRLSFQAGLGDHSQIAQLGVLR